MLNPFRRGSDPHPLVVGMTGVKLGERFAQIGCAHGGRLGAVAAKVGLSGRADAGVLVDVEITPSTRLPAENDAFDLVVIDDSGGFFGSMAAENRAATTGEARRILRNGGRLLVIGSTGRAGLAGLLKGTPAGEPFDPTPALHAGGFKAIRVLAEREGLVFVEGIKRADSARVTS